MQISFTTRAMQKIANNSKVAVRELGEKNAAKFKQRLLELAAAPSMADIPAHAGCHLLKGDKKGLYALNLKQPHRLIFQPHCEELPLKEDGGLDLSKVTEIIIISVEDYH
ncbi:MAG: killer suppression protein [Candidatus Cloacimonetes bacterium HGW-Cloacimonetes-3]|jgi:proteic killer suppression protein|nr:MAG: killer suppression protein [Candidatus Cloacimonetes bacterium HGW-Cloacimonetes-3]